MGIIVYFSLFIFYFLISKILVQKREAFIYAVSIWGTLILYSTNILSFFHLIKFYPILIFWILVIFVTIYIFLFHQNLKIRVNLKKINFKYGLEYLNTIYKFFIQLNFVEIFIIFSLLVTLIIGLFAAPNTMDSMTYHLPRIGQWIENQSVAFFVSNNPYQNFHHPFAEYCILHLQVLNFGYDNLANSVQWLGYLGSIITVSLIVQIIGGNKQAQSIAALIVATTPMIILQSTSTQVDLYGAFWAIITVYFAFKLIKEKNDKVNLIFFAIALSLAILTRLASAIFLFPILFCMMIIFIYNFFNDSKNESNWKNKIFPFLIIIFGICIFILINIGPHLSRTYNVYDHISGPKQSLNIWGNESYTIKFGLINFIKNVFMHFGTPISSINLGIVHVVENIGSILGVDINDPKILFNPFTVMLNAAHEDRTGNFINAFIFLFILPFYFIKRLLNRAKISNQKYDIFLLYINTIFGLFIFSILLKWQPWSSRYHVLFFILLSIPMAFFIEEQTKIKKFLLVILCIYSLPFLFLNYTRPVFSFPKNISFIKTLPEHYQYYYSTRVESSVFTEPRIKQMFFKHLSRPQNDKEIYLNTLYFLQSKNCQHIGLFISDGSWQYPLQQISVRLGMKNHFWHVVSENNLTYSLRSKIIPCAIIVMDKSPAEIMDIKKQFINFHEFKEVNIPMGLDVLM